MQLPRAHRLAFPGGHRIRIELEGDVFGEIDLAAELVEPTFAALRERDVFTAARTDEVGVVTWPCGLALDPRRLSLRLKLQQLAIGTEFSLSGRRWRCTDRGTRTLAAIKLEHDDDPSWYSGPPYAVAEHVLDEDALPACELSAEQLEQARERMLSGRLARCACSGTGLLPPRAEIRQPLWAAYGEGGLLRIGRGSVVLERDALAELAREHGVVAELLEERKPWFSEARKTRLHQLFDAPAASVLARP